MRKEPEEVTLDQKDNVISSSNSVMADNGQQLSNLTGSSSVDSQHVSKKNTRRKERDMMLKELVSFDHNMRNLQKGTEKLLHRGVIDNMARLQSEKQERKRMLKEREEEIQRRAKQKEHEHQQRVQAHRKKQQKKRLRQAQ